MKKHSFLLSLLLVLSICGLSACSDSDDDNDTFAPDSSDSASASPSPDASNPIAGTVENFADGPGNNLWKPVSENNGNIVVLFRNIYRTTFSGGCFIDLADGTRTQLYCGEEFGLDCFTNPDRLTMRSSVKCSQAKEVRVTCYDATQEVSFTVDPSIRGNVCSRHD